MGQEHGYNMRHIMEKCNKASNTVKAWGKPPPAQKLK